MPNYPGIVSVSPVQVSDTTYITNEVFEYLREYWPPYQSVMGATPSGPLLGQYPVSQNSIRNLPGAIAHNFGRDWYDRIHVVPILMDLGNLISPQARSVEVWNAYFVAQSLASITPTNTGGLTLTGQPSPPLAYAPLQSRLYQLDATTIGPPVIDARYAFDFTITTVTLRVIGRRIIVFSARPNWIDQFLERQEWATDVLESYDASEQRIALRAAPRRRYEYSWMEEHIDAQYIDTLLWGWGARTYCLPVWTDRTDPVSQISAGATVLTVPDVANHDYRAGGLLVLWKSTTEHEAIEVLSVGAGNVTTALPVGTTWPVGTRIYPARLARIEGEARTTHETDRLSLSRMAWNVEDVDAPPAAGYGATYQGYRVFDLKPDRSEAISASWTRKLAELDYGGIPAYDDESGAPILLRRLSWLLTSRTAITTFRKWIAERRGRLVPFWLPSWQDDMRVTAAMAAVDTGMRISRIGIYQLIGVDTRRRDVLIQTHNNTFYRRVVGVSDFPPLEEGLTLDTSLGTLYQPSQFVVVRWLSLVRLESDAVEYAWETDAVLRGSVTVRVIPG